MTSVRMVQNMVIQPAFPPVDHNDAAVTGDWIKVTGNHITFIAGHSDVAAAVTYTFQQGSNNAGDDNANLNTTVVYDKEHATSLASVGIFTKNTQSAANTWATSSGFESLIVVEWDAQDLTPGLDFVQVAVSDPGAANPGYGLWIISELRFAEQIVQSAL